MAPDDPAPQETLAQARRAAAGDPQAAAGLVDRLYPLVLKIARAHLPRRLDAADLCQIVFVKLFRHLGQYSGAAPLEHWVSRIAVNTCLNELEAERVRPEVRHADLTPEERAVVNHLETPAAELPPDDALASRDLLHRLLATLPPEDRLVLQFLHMEGLTAAEIAGLTGWSATAVKVRAFRARNKLRKRLAYLVPPSA